MTGAGPELSRQALKTRPRAPRNRLCPSRLVDDLRYDIDAAWVQGARRPPALWVLAFFQPAAGHSRAGGDTGMRSASFADPIDRPRDVGCFRRLRRAVGRGAGMQSCVEELMEGFDNLIENVEVHYVRYPEGGYFQRHVDDYERNLGRNASSRRTLDTHPSFAI